LIQTGLWKQHNAAMRRRLLREQFRSGRLEAASSKAAVLSDLCDRLQYDPDAATEVHKGIYTERIETFLEDKTISGTASDKSAASSNCCGFDTQKQPECGTL
jgi:methionyl-tRNA synthetase